MLVLIETYWNVNFTIASNGKLSPGINRNILECKLKLFFVLACNISVLIETYWNVNKANGFPEKQEKAVLIETYWNVNWREKDKDAYGIVY